MIQPVKVEKKPLGKEEGKCMCDVSTINSREQIPPGTADKFC